MERRSWRSTHLLFVLHIWVLLLYHYCKLQVFMCLHFIHVLSRFCFTRNGVFWDACWSWLGARPRTALWQTEGNGTHAVRSAVGRAVGRTAHTGGGRTVEPAAGPRGTRCHRQYSFRRQPEVAQRDKGVTTLTCILPRGRRARARVRQTWGFFMDVYSGEAYGRRVRALQGETSLQVFR